MYRVRYELRVRCSKQRLILGACRLPNSAAISCSRLQTLAGVFWGVPPLRLAKEGCGRQEQSVPGAIRTGPMVLALALWLVLNTDFRGRSGGREPPGREPPIKGGPLGAAISSLIYIVVTIS